MTRVQCIKSVHEHFPPSKTALVSELWIVISEVLNQHVLFGQRTHTHKQRGKNVSTKCNSRMSQRIFVLDVKFDMNMDKMTMAKRIIKKLTVVSIKQMDERKKMYEV